MNNLVDSYPQAGSSLMESLASLLPSSSGKQKKYILPRSQNNPLGNSKKKSHMNKVKAMLTKPCQPIAFLEKCQKGR